jgi:hypothetical protein
LRIFDAVGVVALVGWVGLVGAYTYSSHMEAETERRSLEAGVPIHAGDSWMMLTRDDDEVGFIHETRTAIDGGWLVEYDFMINVTSLGTAQLLRTKVKATMDQTALLKKANVSVQTASALSFEAEVEVKGNDVELRYDIGGKVRTSTVKLQKPPRLSQSAFFQLASMPDLVPGAVFEQEYFDPMVMGMTKMRFRYVRRHEIDVYDSKINAFHFRQEIGNNEFDVYMDDRGEVYIQELPLRIIGARVPETFGQTRAKALERQFRERTVTKGSVTVDDAIGMLRGEGGLERDSIFTIKNIPDGLVVLADSPSQKVISRKLDTIVVDTTGVADKSDLPQETIEGMKVNDADFENFDWGVFLTLPDAMSTGQRAEKIARSVRDGLLKTEDITSFGKAKILAEALRRIEIPAQMVYGFERTDAGMKPHYWVQYFDGTRLVDLDPNRPTLLAGTAQVQLGVSANIDRKEYEDLFGLLMIERTPLQGPKITSPSDFN